MYLITLYGASYESNGNAIEGLIYEVHRFNCVIEITPLNFGTGAMIFKQDE